MRKHKTPPRSLFFFLSLVALASACGIGLQTPNDSRQPTLFVVDAHARGTLAADFTGELRGALAWSVYSPELIACLDDIAVDHPLDPSNEQDFETMARLQVCWDFSERGHVENASVAIEAELPSRFSIPVVALPDQSVLSGSSEALLGLADVIVYADDNENGVLDETPRGADAFIDRVVGTSHVVDEAADAVSWIVYREGAVSPLWKLFHALYGCADPAPGFSRVRIQLEPTLACTFDQEPIDVVLGDDLSSVGCAADPASHVMQRPSAEAGWPTDADGICEPVDGYYDLALTENASSVCPSFRHLTLVGCSDTSSLAACEATLWNDLGNAPAWWPCNFSDGTTVSFQVVDAVFATDGNDDKLFDLFWQDGLGDVALSQVEVALDDEATPALDIILDPAGYTLVDRDGNGVFNAGDRIVVGESSNQLTSQTPAGAYRVRVTIAGFEVQERALYYSPTSFPDETGSIILATADAADVITDGIDDIAILTHTGVVAGSGVFLFSQLAVSIYVGGELPLYLSVENGGLLAANDVDGDGVFELGDSLLLRDAINDPLGQLTPEMIADFGDSLYIGLNAPTAVNTRAQVASVEMTVE